MSFKCDPSRFLELTDVPGIVPAPYLARAHWVQVTAAGALTDAQARELVARSHALVIGEAHAAGARSDRRDCEVLNHEGHEAHEERQNLERQANQGSSS